MRELLSGHFITNISVLFYGESKMIEILQMNDPSSSAFYSVYLLQCEII